jgi:abortive infection bacteriophage resistance protein
MPILKEFSTLDEQVELLKTRGLKIKNEKNAKKHLLEKNYFNLMNGFETLLLEDPKATPKKYINKTFEDFIILYDFDQRFSSEIMKSISAFENKLKSSIAYRFCEVHCINVADIEKYIDLSCYRIPSASDGPRKFVENFYHPTDSKKRHSFFKQYNKSEAFFKGTFKGTISTNPYGITLYIGEFTGAFLGKDNNTIRAKFIHDGTVPLPTFSADPLTGLHTGSGDFSGKFKDLNYIDYNKTKYDYINRYEKPPLWVIIKTLMLNDLIILLYGLQNNILNLVMKDLGFGTAEREKFFNSLEIIKELRNCCAHFELINRFRTNSSLTININLINDLKLVPLRGNNHVLNLFDTIKVLGQFVNLKDTRKILLMFFLKNIILNKGYINKELLKRIGGLNIKNWVKI